MSVLAELRIPPTDFALAETFTSFPDLVVCVQRVTAQPTGRPLSLCWFRGDLDLAFEDVLRRDPTVEDARRLVETEQGDLYYVRWVHRVRRLIRSFAMKGNIVETVGTRRNWSMSVLFADHQNASELQAILSDRGLPFTLERLSTPTGPLPNPMEALTSKQRETLLVAAESGFYGVPRRIDMNELADRLDITQQAASTRLRRAHAALVRSALPEAETEVEADDDSVARSARR